MLVISIGEKAKGKRVVIFDNGVEVSLYQKEISTFHLEENMPVSEEDFQEIFYEILGKRVKKRALFLLEKMDRTEHQLREKLLSNRYPSILIEEAIEYVKEFHYVDDLRFANNYIQYRQNTKSAMRLKQELLQKGITKTIVEQALDESYGSDEIQMIKQWIVKKHYCATTADQNEKRKIYQFLIRKGFKNDDIIHALKCEDYLT